MRLTELDGVRGLAAISVVFYHYFTWYDELFGHHFKVPGFFELGKYGVHLFFIVSGFVIFWTISRSEKPLDFVWSRFCRLYPPFWFAAVLTFLFLWLYPLPARDVEFSTLLLNLFMFHEYFNVKHVDGVYWTLTLELTFYFWVLVIFSSGRLGEIEKILIIWVSFASIITFYKLNIEIGSLWRKLFLLDYIELFAAGICFYRYKSKTQTRYTHILIALSILSLFSSYSSLIAVSLSFFYFTFWLIVINKFKILRNTVLVYLGSISYSLYLVHQNIGYIIINKSHSLGFHPIFGIFIAFSFSIITAHMILLFIERPSLKQLKNFYTTNKTMGLLRRRWS